MSDSDLGHGEYKTFRQISRDRLLNEMLQTTKSADCRSAWKVLVMDKITVKVMSSSCKMADITDEGISLVEDLYKRRQPMPSMEAIYFIHPSKENVVFFISDMSGRIPLYKKAFVFFSSPVAKELVSMIKNDTSILPRIGALREMNLEYFAVDSQGFVTDNDRALEELFGEDLQNSRVYDTCINTMANRIATVFASLKEFPSVRFRAAKSSLEASTETTCRDLAPTKLAAVVWNCISQYKTTIPNFPQTETCDLLIVDRSVDQIAPLIHEWTYDAMCHDLLEMDGNKYVYESRKSGGEPEKKEVILEDHDPVWLELRHAHIADASERLHDKMTNFVTRNKAAQIHTSRDSGELSTRDLQKMVQALPQYADQMEKLSLHVEIAGKVNSLIRELGLRDLGQLEQDLVFGEAATKEVINFLRTKQDTTRENKLRLLMIYASIYPEKFEGEQGTKLMQLAKLSQADMTIVNNMKYLVGSDNKKASGGFSLKFDGRRKKNAARKERTDEDETWQLSKFYPIVEELIEKLSKGELPKTEYPCMNTGSPAANGAAQGQQARTSQVPPAAHSMRSRRTATWARPRTSDDGTSSDSVLRRASNEFKRMGQRIFIFIIGGATRSELRVAHKLTKKLSREVVLGSSSLDDPLQFIEKVKLLTKELSVDDIHI